MIERAKAEGIPVIAYDAPIDTSGVLYTSFDNVAVGRVMATRDGQGRAEGQLGADGR